MKTKTLSFIAILLIFAGAFTACEKIDLLNVDTDAIFANAEGGTFQIAVSSNGEWNAVVQDAENNSWLTLNNASGTNNGVFTVNIAENQLSETRNAMIRVSMGALSEIVLVEQEAYVEKAPVLYFAVRRGNIMALKLIENTPNIPFDTGVSAGATPFNILFNEPTDELFILDAGLRFTFMTFPVPGDGDIRVMSADGSQVETVLKNRGHEFNDPFFGFIQGNYLYYSNRNTGVMRIPLNTRNVTTNYDTADAPWFFENRTTGWNGRGISYGAVNSAFLRIGDVWWWGKSGFNASFGIFRFRESDIQSERVPSASIPAPEAGAILPGVPIRALLWDDINEVLYFTTIGASATSGVFRATPAELETITSVAGLEPFRLTMADDPDRPEIRGQNLTIRVSTPSGFPSEGFAPFELIGIPQLALDRATGNVYFGFRSGNPNLSSGLMRVNASLPGNEVIEYVIYDIEGITGVAINNKPTRLF